MSACLACAIEEDIERPVPDKYHTCAVKVPVGNVLDGHTIDCPGRPGWKGICNCGKDPRYTVYEMSTDEQATWHEVARIVHNRDGSRSAWFPPTDLTNCWMRTRDLTTGFMTVWHLPRAPGCPAP